MRLIGYRSDVIAHSYYWTQPDALKMKHLDIVQGRDTAYRNEERPGGRLASFELGDASRTKHRDRPIHRLDENVREESDDDCGCGAEV